jgi:hypothetical protein
MAQVYISTTLRRVVIDRAGGRCEYCGIPEHIALTPLELDHIISQKHGGQTDADNLALSCALCNKLKGSNIASVDPETGQLVFLFHPRRDRWNEHFRLDGAHMAALTPPGRVTIRLLQLNRPERVAERELLIAAGLFLPLAQTSEE